MYLWGNTDLQNSNIWPFKVCFGLEHGSGCWIHLTTFSFGLLSSGWSQEFSKVSCAIRSQPHSRNISRHYAYHAVQLTTWVQISLLSMLLPLEGQGSRGRVPLNLNLHYTFIIFFGTLTAYINTSLNFFKGTKANPSLYVCCQKVCLKNMRKSHLAPGAQPSGKLLVAFTVSRGVVSLSRVFCFLKLGSQWTILFYVLGFDMIRTGMCALEEPEGTAHLNVYF